MIGQLAFAVWIATVTLAGIYFGQQYTGGSAHGEAAAESHVRHNDFRTDLFAIPYVNETGIVGYVTGRFTVKTVASQEAGLMIPLPTLIFDALSRHFYAEAGELAKPEGWTRLRESLAELRDIANESAGRDVIAEVLIEQLDFFPKDSVRMPGNERFESTDEK
jgi:F420-0:gamma-glutamyl ligase-like protein